MRLSIIQIKIQALIIVFLIINMLTHGLKKHSIDIKYLDISIISVLSRYSGQWWEGNFAVKVGFFFAPAIITLILLYYKDWNEEKKRNSIFNEKGRDGMAVKTGPFVDMR